MLRHDNATSYIALPPLSTAGPGATKKRVMHATPHAFDAPGGSHLLRSFPGYAPTGKTYAYSTRHVASYGPGHHPFDGPIPLCILYNIFVKIIVSRRSSAEASARAGFQR